MAARGDGARQRLKPRHYHLLKRSYWHVNAVLGLFNPAFRYMLRRSLFYGGSRALPYTLEFTQHRINKAIAWILYHQALQPDGGVTSWVRFSRGRLVIDPSYPEVTGYIIPTLFDYATVFDAGRAFDAAVEAADFELPLQHPAGYFPASVARASPQPSVFNSAQIAHGLVRAFRETEESKYLSAAVRACRWICEVQDADGAWGRMNYQGMKRTYDTKVCQALLEADQAQGSGDFSSAVNRNLEFVLRNQKRNGWFYNCDNSYERNHMPLTHTIAYTTQGLLACYRLTGREDLLQAATSTLRALMQGFETSKRLLAGRFFSDWRPAVTSSCVTGDAQLSLCWIDVYEITGDYRYLNAALKMNDFLKHLQYDCRFKEIDGALPGSHPVWGDYFPYQVNSWGVKYYADALIKEHQLKTRLLEEAAR